MSEPARLVAWHQELLVAHDLLREVLAVTRAAVETAEVDPAAAHRDLLLYCHGFCVTLGAHHRGEDSALFPELRARHPELDATISKLEQDHSMIAHLLGALDDAVQRSDEPAALARHLEGLSAIMESHFRYEERQLAGILATLDLAADPQVAFGTTGLTS